MNDPRSDICSICISRRTVLRGGAVGAAGALLATLPAGCMQGYTAPMGPVAAGNVSDIAVGTLKIVTGENVILARDTGGLYAMTRVCTHQGQLVKIVTVAGAPALHCDGHGSDFSITGAVTRGPASSPLEHFKVDLDPSNGSITIQGGMVVAATDRTPV